MAKREGTGNLIDLAKFYSDEDKAIELLERLRWPSGAACPRCGGDAPYKLKPKASGKNPARRGLYKCRACKRQFSVTVGTVFEASHIPVSKWLMAMHLLCASKKGISAHQLHRMLNVTYKAAWFMAHRLRHAMAQDVLLSKLTGIVEADRRYIGAKLKRGTKAGRPGVSSHKVPVIALIERGGRVRAFPVERVTANTLRTALRKHVDPNATLMTDEYQIYDVAGKEFARHDRVNHGRKEYVRGDAYTNTAEGFFSLLKRGINGSFHHVSRGHLHRLLLGVRVPAQHPDRARHRRQRPCGARGARRGGKAPDLQTAIRRLRGLTVNC